MASSIVPAPHHEQHTNVDVLFLFIPMWVSTPPSRVLILSWSFSTVLIVYFCRLVQNQVISFNTVSPTEYSPPLSSSISPSWISFINWSLGTNLRSRIYSPALKSSYAFKMCNYFKNYYIYSTCTQPDSHFLRTSLDGSKENRCPNGPHDRFIIVVGKCHLCAR